MMVARVREVESRAGVSWQDNKLNETIAGERLERVPTYVGMSSTKC